MTRNYDEDYAQLHRMAAGYGGLAANGVEGANEVRYLLERAAKHVIRLGGSDAAGEGQISGSDQQEHQDGAGGGEAKAAGGGDSAEHGAASGGRDTASQV